MYIYSLDPPRTYAADLLRESSRGKYRLGVVARIDAECRGDPPREPTIRPPRTKNLAVAKPRIMFVPPWLYCMAIYGYSKILLTL